MKRLILIVSCLFLIIAGATSAWASCKQENFSQSESSSKGHKHDHHSSSHHEHKTAIHCPTLDPFLLTAAFSSAKNDAVKRLTIADVPESADQFGASQLYRSLHGPPGNSRYSNIPFYLALSVLRI